MYRLLAAVLAFIFAGGWSQTLIAQDETRAVPVEFFACDFVDGKGMADLLKVAADFEQWAAKNDPSYSAWILTPQFHNSRDEEGENGMFDVGWLGSWPDGNAFGRGQQTWMDKGQDMAEAFGRVMDCGSRHELVSSAVINAPEGPPGDGVVMFAQCSLQEGKTLQDSFDTHKKLAAAMQAMGSPAVSWLFYPGLGAGDISFHYWRVIAFNDYVELGAAAELYTNGGGWQKTMEILGPVARCGSASVFDARRVRAGEAG